MIDSSDVLRWRKLGLVFSPQALPERPPWLAEFAQAPATLLFDDRVRVFFSCRPPAGPDGMYVSRSAFVDLDRGDLTRVLCVSDEPILPLGGTGEFDAIRSSGARSLLSASVHMTKPVTVTRPTVPRTASSEVVRL